MYIYTYFDLEFSFFSPICSFFLGIVDIDTLNICYLFEHWIIHFYNLSTTTELQ